MEATSVKVMNYIDGEWREPEARETLNVVNPATGEVMGQVPLSTAAEVQQAAEAAATAQKDWRRVPATDRISTCSV
jgi:malonate-semialdehyde dehydrogenase (acetylating)/methylmalonate-semialdehyde dehydrogenase